MTMETLVRRVHGLLQRLLPLAFRERFGGEISEAFARGLGARRGLFARGVFAIRACADVIQTAVAERWQTLSASGDVGADGLERSRSGASRWPAAAFGSRSAWRAIKARPMSSAAIVLTLGIGLGAATAMFTVTDAVLLRPLPYPDDERLVRMHERHQQRPQWGVSIPALTEWTALPGVDRLAGFEAASGTLWTPTDPVRVSGASVSPGFFVTLGVAPAIGRAWPSDGPLFDPHPKIILSDALWREHFGARPNVVGETASIDRDTYRIEGVMPPGFAYPEGARFWRTLSPDMRVIADARDLRFLDVVARLKPDAEVATVASQLDAWSERQRALQAGMSDWRPVVRSLRDEAVGPVRQPLLVTSGGVLLLLLIACCNVAALLVAQGYTRRRALALHSALGASRTRLMGTVLWEAGILTAAGAVLAVFMTVLTQRVITTLSVDQLPRIELMALDWRALGAMIALGGVTVLLSACLPAWMASRVDAAPLMGAPRTVAGDRGRVLPTLAAVEFGLAVMLLATAGLLANSYRHLSRVELGFDPSDVRIARVDMPIGGPWSDDVVRRQTYSDLLDRLRATPAIGQAAFATRLPLEQSRGGVDVARSDDPTTKPLLSLLQESSEGYLDTVGIPLTEGRDFAASDDASRPRVAIINDVLARHLFGGETALGRSIRFRYMRGPVVAQVIGVTRAVRFDGLTAAQRPEVYVPFRQSVAAPMALAIKSGGDSAAAVVPALRAVVRGVNPALVVHGISSLDDRLATQFVRPRLFLVLVGTFAIVALILAGVGIYGMLAFWTSQRRRELGVRLALGATRAQVAALVLRRGLFVAFAGIAGGLVVTLAAGRFVESRLFGVKAADPLTLAAAAGILLLAAGAVCIIPGRQAARVHPMETLRPE